MSTRASTRVLRIGHHVSHVAMLYPAAKEVLAARAAAIDGWPSGGDGTGRGSSTTSTTEAAAVARSTHSLWEADLDAGVKALEAIVADLLRQCQDAIRGAYVIPAVPLCESVGRQGADVWGSVCDRAADKDGLCTAHYHAERRWRLTVGLPTRKSIEAAA